MTEVGSVYAQALYALAKDEALSASVLEQLEALDECFSREPDFLRLLGSPNIPKQERCRILDTVFRGKVQPYVLNFMKLLTEKGYIRYFSDCRKSFQQLYNQDNGILVVTAVTAVALNEDQATRLKSKLSRITGKIIQLENRVDHTCLGGMRLDYDGKRVDDTVAHRLDTVRQNLKNTVL